MGSCWLQVYEHLRCSSVQARRSGGGRVNKHLINRGGSDYLYLDKRDIYASIRRIASKALVIGLQNFAPVSVIFGLQETRQRSFFCDCELRAVTHLKCTLDITCNCQFPTLPSSASYRAGSVRPGVDRIHGCSDSYRHGRSDNICLYTCPGTICWGNSNLPPQSSPTSRRGKDMLNRGKAFLKIGRRLYLEASVEVFHDLKRVGDSTALYEHCRVHRVEIMRSILLLTSTLILALKPFASAHHLRYTERRNPSAESVTRMQNAQGPQSLVDPSPKYARDFPRRGSVYQLGSGWKLYLESTTSFLPISIAASALSTFYLDIMSFAIAAAEAAEEEVLDLTIQFGHMFLDFIASEELSPVSWDLVHDLAAFMLKRTERGFTGGYHATLMNGGNLIVVRIGLKAMDYYGAGPTS